MSISGATKLYGVVGDPIAHSLSPMIHNLWLAQLGIDAVYGALHLRTQAAGEDLRALARAGYAGLNVTLPHKLAALGCAARRSPEAERIGAANTLVRESDLTWSAHNTDVTGFAAALAAALGNRPAGARICLIGAGGSARAVAAHLAAAGARLAIVNRTRANAEQLAAELAPGAETHATVALAPHGSGGRDLDVVRLALQEPGAIARTKAAAEEAEAARVRADEAELRQLQERAAQARAKPFVDAGAAPTVREPTSDRNKSTTTAPVLAFTATRTYL
jgi:shikimate dehydrogenase